MLIIHFTSNAADPLADFAATGTCFVPLLKGQGSFHVSCLHLNSGALIPAPSGDHAAALLVVHGRITITTLDPPMPTTAL
jgi:hypothetical protein